MRWFSSNRSQQARDIWILPETDAGSVLKKWDGHLATLLNQKEFWLISEPVPVFQNAASGLRSIREPPGKKQMPDK